MADSFLISHSHETGRYQVWEWKPDANECALVRVEGCDPEASLGSGYRVTWVGNYLLCWNPPTYLEPAPAETYFDFMLVEFNPYRGGVGKIVQMGSWSWSKFAGGYFYNNLPPAGGEGVNTVFDLILEGATGYVIAQLPTAGRSTFRVFSFDAYVDQPGAAQDPLSVTMGPQDAFPNVGPEDELLAYGNVVNVINRSRGTQTIYSFDPQRPNPLSGSPLSQGPIGIELHEKLVVVGEQVISWTPGKREHLIFELDENKALANPRKGRLPEDFPMDADMHLTAIYPQVQVDPQELKTPGSLGYMRGQIEHVIYYVLESRSFDNVLGWLYESPDVPSHWIGVSDPSQQVFKGASTSNSNSATGGGTTVTQNQFQYPSYESGNSVSYDQPMNDPFHGTPDSIHQQWSGGYPAYQAGNASDMLGFLQNNADDSVMGTYTPAQLTVLNGLAKSYAVSDMWFCSEAGGTTTNRASLASGSAFNITADYESGEAYTNFPNNPHRQSMWKVLANHGHTDWAIFYSVEWLGFPYTYHLYLKGQLPSVDEYPGDYVQPVQSFFDGLNNGHLPKFSFIEPIWYLPNAPFTSYHPTGDLLPGEAALAAIYNALIKSSYWNKTALVISFSKGGGIYDHEPAVRMTKAWPHDGVDGYGFDTTGARVPTIVVSPLVEDKTVFRSGDAAIPFDHTSLPATILSWHGIPRWRWGMGDRIEQAPTFENLFTRTSPRTDATALTPASDATWPDPSAIPITAPSPVNRTWTAGGSDWTWSTWTAYQSWKERPTSDCAGISNYDQWKACTEALPTATATFKATTNTTVSFGFNDPQQVNELVFEADAPAYTFVFDEEQPSAPTLTISGSPDPTTVAGVTNSSTHTQTMQVSASNTSASQVQLNFINSACARTSGSSGPVVYNVGPSIYEVGGTVHHSQSGGIVAFNQRSTAGDASFNVSVGPRPIAGYATVGAEVRFMDHSSAASATFTVTGTTGLDGDTFGNVVFHNFANAGTATFTNVGGTVPGGDGGNTQFYGQASADHCTIINQGATGGEAGDEKQANGGDVAFDGTATADHASIENQAASNQYGYGGVTSFNNNRPYMGPIFGATAGNATIDNKGASATDAGGGGHTEFTGIYGAGTAGSATITNHGSSNPANTEGGGYTRFSVNGWWPKSRPNAGQATINNLPAGAAGAQAGSTIFNYVNYTEQKKNPSWYPTDYGPSAGSATIFNGGGVASGVAGASTTFDHASDAGSAKLYAAGVAGGGDPGQIVFKKLANGASAYVQLTTGGKLDMSESERTTIDFGELSLGSSTITMGPSKGIPGVVPLQVSGAVNFPDNAAVVFEYTGTQAKGGTYTLITGTSLTKGTNVTFSGAPSGMTAQYTVSDSSLTVTLS